MYFQVLLYTQKCQVKYRSQVSNISNRPTAKNIQIQQPKFCACLLKKKLLFIPVCPSNKLT